LKLLKREGIAGCQQLMPVILAIEEVEIRRIVVRSPISQDPYLEKPFTKIGLVECLKVKTLSSSPSTSKNKNKKKRKGERHKE
jgi:hypothetical protein